MSFNAIRENKILTKISGSTVCYLFACWVNFHVFVVIILLTIFKINFFENSFTNTIRASNRLDPGIRAATFRPNYLQSFSADDKVATTPIFSENNVFCRFF